MEKAKLLEFAAIGARARVAEIEAQLAEARAVLDRVSAGKKRQATSRRPMTAAQRAAIGRRMTAYWAMKRGERSARGAAR
jgi:hypothetical protein